jgi:hypothetical protein
MANPEPHRSRRPWVPAGLDVSAVAKRLELFASGAQEAAADAERRATAARQRRDAAAARVAELRDERIHPIHRPEEAATRLTTAEKSARVAHKLALEELERAAVAHEEAAQAHERAADLAESRGDLERAQLHRHKTRQARAAARADRQTAAHRTEPGNPEEELRQEMKRLEGTA